VILSALSTNTCLSGHCEPFAMWCFVVMSALAVVAAAQTTWVLRVEFTSDMRIANRKCGQEDLLNSLIPRIFTKKNAKQTQDFPDAVVMYADMVGFTASCKKFLQSRDIYNKLTEIFEKFDEIAAKYDITKIETIGDCYVACRADLLKTHDNNDTPGMRSNAERMACFALEVQEWLTTNVTRPNPDPDQDDYIPATFRFGCSAGPVTGGIVGGQSMLRFHVFGPTERSAQRLETNAVDEHGNPCIRVNAKFAAELAATLLNDTDPFLQLRPAPPQKPRAAAQTISGITRAANFSNAPEDGSADYIVSRNAGTGLPLGGVLRTAQDAATAAEDLTQELIQEAHKHEGTQRKKAKRTLQKKKKETANRKKQIAAEMAKVEESEQFSAKQERLLESERTPTATPTATPPVATPARVAATIAAAAAGGGDKLLPCRNRFCPPFTFSEAEQEEFARKGWVEPKRCHWCRLERIAGTPKSSPKRSPPRGMTENQTLCA